jgi:hypothetical protein
VGGCLVKGRSSQEDDYGYTRRKAHDPAPQDSHDGVSPQALRFRVSEVLLTQNGVGRLMQGQLPHMHGYQHQVSHSSTSG